MNSPPAAAPDPGRCPLCGGANGCAMEEERRTGVPQAPCWCTRVEFQPSLLARVPAEASGRACICSHCAGAPPAGP